MVEKDSFILLWRRSGKMYLKVLEKEPVIAAFEGLIKGFSNDNEISKKLVNVISGDIKALFINWDNTQDINKVFYAMNDQSVDGIAIISHHKIVWAILNGYSMVGREITEKEFEEFALLKTNK